MNPTQGRQKYEVDLDGAVYFIKKHDRIYKILYCQIYIYIEAIAEIVNKRKGTSTKIVLQLLRKAIV